MAASTGRRAVVLAPHEEPIVVPEAEEEVPRRAPASLAGAEALDMESIAEGCTNVEEINPAELQFLDTIGVGAMASVYRARWRDKQVAVKEVHSDYAKRMLLRKTLQRELRVMVSVDHPHLVKLHGVCSMAGPFQFVMELCAGGALFELLYDQIETDISWDQQVKMFMDVASAMNYLHHFDPQIIHRDLKSLNLLLDREFGGVRSTPNLLVTDFGLAKINDAHMKGRMTQDVGTIYWMAPEVLAHSDYDEKVDVYSFGIVMFEVIGREVPWDGERPATVMEWVRGGGRPDLDAVPPDCPPVLVRLMTACWAQDPHDRPTFEHVINVLRGIRR